MNSMRYILHLIILFFILLSPVQTQNLEDIKSSIKGIYTNFTGNFSYSSDSGDLYNGKIYYQYPNKLNIQLTNGSVIATNGKYLWIYDPASNVCARQNVKEEGVGGLFYFVHPGYLVSEDNGRYIFSKPDALLSEVSLKLENNFPKSIQFKLKDNVINISFSNVVTDTSIKASLFNYKPGPEVQLVENPLNKIGDLIIRQSTTEKNKEN